MQTSGDPSQRSSRWSRIAELRSSLSAVLRITVNLFYIEEGAVSRHYITFFFVSFVT